MPKLIPLTPAGDRVIQVNLGGETLSLRCYFVHGQSDHWLLDISDAQGRPLFSGLNLVPGLDNLLKGRGDSLENGRLLAVTRPRAGAGAETGLNAPGNDLFLVWLEPGETNPLEPGDPMDAIGEDLTW